MDWTNEILGIIWPGLMMGVGLTFAGWFYRIVFVAMPRIVLGR